MKVSIASIYAMQGVTKQYRDKERTNSLRSTFVRITNVPTLDIYCYVSSSRSRMGNGGVGRQSCHSRSYSN